MSQNNILIDLEDLKVLNSLNAIIDKKSPYNIIRNIQIKGTEEGIKLTATNLEILINQEIKLKDNTSNLVGKEVKIKSNILLDCLKKLSGKIELQMENNKLNIIDKNGKFVLVSSEDKYPEEEVKELTYKGTVLGEVFVNAIKKTNINVNIQEKGVCKLELKDNKLTVLVYDQKRICFHYCEAEHDPEEFNEFVIMISPKYLKEIIKIKGDVRIYGNEKKLMLCYGSSNIIIKSIDANNVNHLRFISDLGNNISVNTKDFKNAVERGLITSSELIRDLFLNFSDTKLAITSYDPTIGGSKTEYAIHGNIKEDIFINGDDLLDMISLITNENITFFIQENKRNLIFFADNTYYILATLVLKKNIPEINVKPNIGFYIEAEKVTPCLDSLNAIIDKKSPYNIIRNIQIKGTEEGIKLTATNLEILINQEIKLKDNTSNLVGKEVKIKSNILLDCLKKLSGKIELQMENNKLNIIDKNGKFVLVSSEDKYPEEEVKELTYKGTVLGEVFVNAIKKTNINVNIQEKGVCKLELKDNKLTVLVYDQKRICFHYCEAEHDPEEFNEFVIMISPKYLKEIIKIKGDVRIYGNEKKLMLCYGSSNIIIKSIDANNVNHLRFISDLGNNISVNTKDFKNAVEKCLVNVAAQILPKLKFQINNKEMEIQYYDYIDDTYTQQIINCENQNIIETIKFQLNGNHVLDLLKVLSGDVLHIFPKMDKRDIVFKSIDENSQTYYINIKLVTIKQ